MKIDPNGPVFPHHGNGMFGEPVTYAPGMTYRQWLVGMIAQGMSGSDNYAGRFGDGSSIHSKTYRENFASDFIAQADAVIAALNAEDSN